MSKAALAAGVPGEGTVIAEKYRVLSVLGSGGMGCVVEADHLLLHKRVAIKFLRADTSASAQRRLFREARAAQALSSEHVVRMFDLGVHEGAPYIVMELLEGIDLAARVHERGPLPVEEAVDCLLEACVAVAEAHAVGIFHRDIKPANLFSTRTATLELVKVVDFGISKLPDRPGVDDCDKTAEDGVLGTPHYMSPEQLRNPAKIDARTDVWALAVTLYHLLSGEHPFRGETPGEVMSGIFTDEPRDLRALRPEVPEELWRCIRACLEKRTEERTATVAALVEDLLPFAGVRGRRAADRISAMGAPPPPVERPSLATLRAAATTTDAGLSSTLPSTDEPARPAGPARSPESSVRTRVPTARTGLAAFVAFGVVAAAIAWLSGDRSPAVAPPASSSAVPTGDDSATPPVSAAATAPTAATETAAQPVESVALPPAPPRPTPVSSAAGARPNPRKPPPAISASAPAAPVKPATSAQRRDIDGFPILD